MTATASSPAPQRLRARAQTRPLLGIDLGGTKILAGIVGPDGRILSRAKKKTRADRGPDQILERIIDAAREAAIGAGLRIADLQGAGIGAPGQIDFPTGTIVYAPNLGWHDFPLRARLADALGLAVTLDNDANAVALAEHAWGAGEGADDVVAITVGTGIGAGIILGGQLRHGFRGTAGEIGHTVIDQDGPEWPASNRGCLEAMASRTAIAQRLSKAMEKLDKKGKTSPIYELTGGDASKIRSKFLQQAVDEEDALVLEELERASRLLGIAVGNVINFLNPEVVVMGGGVIEAVGDVMMPTIEKVARKTAISSAGEGVKIVPSRLGDDAGLLGAAALAR